MAAIGRLFGSIFRYVGKADEDHCGPAHQGCIIVLTSTSGFSDACCLSNTTDHPIHCLDRLQRAHRQNDAARRCRSVPWVYADMLPGLMLTFPAYRGYARTGPELDNCQSLASNLFQPVTITLLLFVGAVRNPAPIIKHKYVGSRQPPATDALRQRWPSTDGVLID